jgi:hypothetical protein
MPAKRPALRARAPSPMKVAVAPVVSHEPRGAPAEPGILVAARRRLAGHAHLAVIPLAPVPGRAVVHGRIGVEQQPVVGGAEMAVSLTIRNALLKALPLLGKEPAHSPSGPVDLALCAAGDREEDQLADRPRMKLSVGEPEHRTPRSPEHEPAIDPKVRPQGLDVCDQVPRRVPIQGVQRARRVRRATTTAPLIEQHDTVDSRVEQLSPGRVRAGAWTAVQYDRRLSLGVPAELPIDAVSLPDLQPPARIWRRLRVRR